MNSDKTFWRVKRVTRNSQLDFGGDLVYDADTGIFKRIFTIVG